MAAAMPGLPVMWQLPMHSVVLNVVAAAAIITCGVASSASSASPGAARFNVLYIVVDDLRPDISPYHVQNAAPAATPNFARLAATGTVFMQAYVQQCGAQHSLCICIPLPLTTKSPML